MAYASGWNIAVLEIAKESVKRFVVQRFHPNGVASLPA
jgi:hypothetical protein